MPLDTPVVVIPEPTDRSSYQGLRFIGLIYLAIGIYVLFRRWTAPRATHFYLFCLVSFALNALQSHRHRRPASSGMRLRRQDRLLVQHHRPERFSPRFSSISPSASLKSA